MKRDRDVDCLHVLEDYFCHLLFDRFVVENVVVGDPATVDVACAVCRKEYNSFGRMDRDNDSFFMSSKVHDCISSPIIIG